MPVAVMRSCAGNHFAESSAGAVFRIGPPSPFTMLDTMLHHNPR